MATVTVYKSAQDLATGTSLSVFSGLDDSGVADVYAVGDLVTTQGGNYTIVKGPIPATSIILQKGLFYVLIDSAI